MKVLTYEDQKIIIVRKTEAPMMVIRDAATLTTGNFIKSPEKLVERLLKANHTSLFEHVSMTLLIRNVSRSFLAQITRHRMSSFTSASQHYQDYSDYPIVVSPDINIKDLDYLHWQNEACSSALKDYKDMMDEGIPQEEARQILPNAMAVKILWTINARSLINFLNLRLCNRNVLEMRMFAINLHKICQDWFPELFNFVGPDCFMTECKQGAMSCQKESQ